MSKSASVAQGGVILPPSKETIESKFDLSIALALASWPALTLAVQSLFGGPQSSEKRDWFAGAISDLLQSTPDADAEYVEEFMLQVMNDEFEIVIEDGSGKEVAETILKLRKLTLEGDFELVDRMMAQWEERQRKGGGKVSAKFVERKEEDDDTDWDSDDVEESEEGDTNMEDAPHSIEPPREKAPPEIDEDGFTKVVGKKRR